jgi:hypothetical protein
MNMLPNLSKSLICSTLGLASLLPQLVMPAPALAQVGEVPAPNAKGDYTTGFRLGNRGHYGITNWVVTDPTYLNCRYAPGNAGKLRSRIAPGAIIYAVFRGPASALGPADAMGRRSPLPKNDAVVMSDGVPWLRISGTEKEVAFPERGEFQNLGECYVRANSRYIAPVNPDATLTNRMTHR